MTALAMRDALDTAPGMPPLLRIEHVQLGYETARGRHVAVDDVDLALGADERLTVIGPSGCGKSTLLRAIAGLLAPLAGRIAFDGRPVTKPGPDRAVVFQDFDQLLPWRSVLGNVAYPLRVNGLGRRRADERARELLDLTDLSAAADRHPHELSGGMKQRVAIARALALQPRLLLMDEPFGALDAITRERLQGRLREILDETRTALVFVTHSIDEALLLGDRVLVLAGAPSRVVALHDVGTPDSQGEARTQLQALLADDRGDDRD
ncbi:MAG: ABC transporter ATP-binding protein [Actinomycetota bacterium]